MFLFQNFFAYKYHWSESRVSVVLQVGPHALLQVDRLLHDFFNDEHRGARYA